MTWNYFLRNNLLLITLFSFCFIQSCNKSSEVVKPIPEESPNKPNWTEFTGPLPEPGAKVCLVVGQTRKAGIVDVAIDGDFLLVTTQIDKENTYLKKVYLEIFNSIDELKEEGKLVDEKLVFGQFDFKKNWEPTEKENIFTVKLPLSDISIDQGCFNIAIQVVLSSNEVSWGALCQENNPGITLDDSNKFPGTAWSAYFDFCPEERIFNLDYTYAWEDINNTYLNDNINDADYNDLVIQADVLRTDGKLKVTFLAAARGASLDHSFKFKIPKKGIILSSDAQKSPLIFGAEKVEDKGDKYYVTVFSSTKAVLPAENYPSAGYASNASKDDSTCTPNAKRSITVLTNEDFDFNPDFPYDPFIRVSTNNGFAYDLNIWELHEADGTGSTWVNAEGKLMPNGIIIYGKWQWLIERKVFTKAYPDFSNITDGWNYNWASNLADPSAVWSCE